MGNYRTQPGDSGALVAYKGEGHHYSAGVQFAKNYGADQIGTAYTPADHILRALRYAEKPISHFWGTSSDRRRPATDNGQ